MGGVTIVLILIFFLPQLILILRYQSVTYSQLNKLPTSEYAIVFGAYVHDDFTLTDVTRERIAAAVVLYRQGKIRKLFISGDNRSNRQAEVMADYAIQNGVAEADIILDKLGIDTHDTCWHFAKIANSGLLLTQAYHLPRSLYFCEHEKIDSIGFAVDRLDLLPSRGNNFVSIFATRIFRLAREAGLTWLFFLGIYQKISNEAENLVARVGWAELFMRSPTNLLGNIYIHQHTSFPLTATL